MTFWDWLYRIGPGWPRFKERQIISFAVIALVVMMLWMAKEDKALWDVELFKLLLQALAITGLINMVLGFHFSATTKDEKATENTGRAFAAIEATANAAGATSDSDALHPGDTVQLEQPK